MSFRSDHIALIVRDLDESVDFYTRTIGFTLGVNPMGGDQFRWIEFGDGRRFHLQAGDISRTFVEKGTHFAFATDDFDAALARLRSVGAIFSDMRGNAGAVNVRPDGMRAVFLQDPNGYWIEINDAQ